MFHNPALALLLLEEHGGQLPWRIAVRAAHAVTRKDDREFAKARAAPEDIVMQAKTLERDPDIPAETFPPPEDTPEGASKDQVPQYTSASSLVRLMLCSTADVESVRVRSC